MAQLTARTILSSVLKSRVAPAAIGLTNQRFYATGKEDEKVVFAPEPQTADPKVYGEFPDVVEHAEGVIRQQMHARLRGDDRFEYKVYYRAPKSSKDYPNLIPSAHKVRSVGCQCDPEQSFQIWGFYHKNIPKRCKCGHWFLVVDADPDSADI
uniref:Cytochrome c oxidase subunit Vb n=1 Tax=Acrobeloides nanus TaxID=290746 RepID=A0A914D1C7_9BILA